MITLYLLGKAFVWCMKVLVLATAAMVVAAAAITWLIVYSLVYLFNYLMEKRYA